MSQRILSAMWRFEIERLCYPLVNGDRRPRLENLVAILLQPLFIIIDLLTLPFIFANEHNRRESQFSVSEQNRNMINSIFGALPALLGIHLHRLLIAIVRESDRGIEEDVLVDPNRRFWYSYFEYYMLLCDNENSMRNRVD
jgi:hypothetical protein